MALHDVYGNDEYATFSEYTSIGADYKSNANIYVCLVAGKKCSSVEEFNRGVQQYMSN
jgi:hypothetical protein